MVFAGSLLLYFRNKNPSRLLQLLGAGCLVIVVLSHLSEALHLFPIMHWGEGHSVGHYLDLSSAFSASHFSAWAISYTRCQSAGLEPTRRDLLREQQ
jgi:hypothetical protein